MKLCNSLRQYFSQEKPFKNKTIVEYYLKTGGYIVYFLKETLKLKEIGV